MARQIHQRRKKAKKAASRTPILRRIALIFIILGLLLTILPALFSINQSIQLMYFNSEVIPVVVKNADRPPDPVRITIPGVSLDLPIGQTTIRNNTWGIYNDGASYLSTSARPGEKGPIILYAHNTLDRFGPLIGIYKNQEVILETADGKKHSYTIIYTAEVAPDKMDVFNQNEETLILYTCSGFADLKRFIVLATPSDSSRQDLE